MARTVAKSPLLAASRMSLPSFGILPPAPRAGDREGRGGRRSRSRSGCSEFVLCARGAPKRSKPLRLTHARTEWEAATQQHTQQQPTGTTRQPGAREPARTHATRIASHSTLSPHTMSAAGTAARPPQSPLLGAPVVVSGAVWASALYRLSCSPGDCEGLLLGTPGASTDLVVTDNLECVEQHHAFICTCAGVGWGGGKGDGEKRHDGDEFDSVGGRGGWTGVGAASHRRVAGW